VSFQKYAATINAAYRTHSLQTIRATGVRFVATNFFLDS